MGSQFSRYAVHGGDSQQFGPITIKQDGKEINSIKTLLKMLEEDVQIMDGSNTDLQRDLLLLRNYVNKLPGAMQNDL